MPDETYQQLLESYVEKLIADSNRNFPLTRKNAITALTPPNGAMIEDVAGQGKEGADIIFKFPDGILFRREVKCVTGGVNSFSRRLSKASAQSDAAKSGDVFIQVQSDYPLQEALERFRFFRRDKPSGEDKYRGVRLQVCDETGAVLYDDAFWEG